MPPSPTPSEDAPERGDEVRTYSTQERRLIPIEPDTSAEELKAWSILIDGVAEATVERIDQERGNVRWEAVEPQHIRRIARLACELIIGRRKLPDHTTFELWFETLRGVGECDGASTSGCAATGTRPRAGR